MGLDNKSYGKRMVPEYLIKDLKELHEATGGNPLVLEKMNKMEEIVDSAGNKRFVEGDITFEKVSGVTPSYGKWSLSGTHLMIVIAGTLANGTVLADSTKLCEFSITNFIYDKIEPLFGNNVLVRSDIIYSPSWSTQTLKTRLRKENDKLNITSVDALTLNSDKNFRVQFDLLIDSD